jgi:hypothetical protein
MSDLLTHALDAPVANILILAGLFFLAVAVLGKIGGKIEPGASGRVLSGILGVILVAVGLQSHAATDAPVHPSRQTTVARDPLAGRWNNQNPETKGITRIEIGGDAGHPTVRAWGKCEPADCDWGTQTATQAEGVIRVTWNQGFVRRNLTIMPDAGRLRVVADSVYTDSRPARQLREYFVR